MESKLPTAAQPQVSVIIVNWNGAGWLPRCLESLAAQTFRDFEVILVDNASTDDSLTEAAQRWPAARLMRLEQNLGYAVANNLAARQASGRWLALLNNDAFPLPDWLAQLVSAAGAQPEYGFYASCLVRADDPQIADGTGDVYHASGLAWRRDHMRPLEHAPRPQGEVFSACAAAALYERQAFLQAGGFEERYDSHFEDVDLGFRLRLAGWRCLYVPQAVALHMGSASYGVETDRTVYRMQRNSLWTYGSDMPGWLLLLGLPAFVLANVIFCVYYWRRGQAASFWRARWDVLRSLPWLWARRRRVQTARRAGAAQLGAAMDWSWLGPYRLGKGAGKIQALRRGFTARNP